MRERARLASKLEIGMSMGNNLEDRGGILGEVTLECFGADGDLKWTETRKNLVTTVGDQYYAARAVAGVNSNGESQPTLVAGMALGTGTTAVAKSSAGSSIGTYVSGSRKNFDSGSPDISAAVVEYKTTWAPGEATNSALSEIAITTNTTDVGGDASSTIARALISPARNKQAGDTLVATWTHTFLGA